MVGSHSFSIGGRFFTSLALIPFSLMDFFASCISLGLRTSMPLFFGGGGGSGTDQSSWFLAIDEGVTPQLLRMDLRGVPEDGRAHEDIAWARPWPVNWHRHRWLRLTRKAQRPVVQGRVRVRKPHL